MRYRSGRAHSGRAPVVANPLALATIMALKISRFVAVWEGFLKDRYLEEFLPSGVPRWNQSLFRARLFATYADAKNAADKAQKKMRKQGIAATVTVRSKEDLF